MKQTNFNEVFTSISIQSDYFYQGTLTYCVRSKSVFPASIISSFKLKNVSVPWVGRFRFASEENSRNLIRNFVNGKS